MKTVNRLYVLVLLVSIIALVAWLLPAPQTISAKADPPAAIEPRQPGQIDQATDLCRFMKLYDRPFKEIEERFNWEMYGYPAELPLSEAIGLFNREKQCSPLYAEHPLLTEEELIAAIVAGPDAGKQGAIWLAQKDALWKIASQKMMPKGARLVASTGGSRSRVASSSSRHDHG